MKKYRELPQIIDEGLGGLKADQALWHRILSGKQAPRAVFRPAWQRAVALAAAFVFVLGLGAVAVKLSQKESPRIITTMAGDGAGTIRQRASDIPRGSIQLSPAGEKPGYIGVWVPGKGANFPLVRVNDRYYRLLSNPTSIGEGLLGAHLSKVDSQTDEPALDTGSGTISNVLETGTDVYAIRGMDGSAVAAEVNGKLRVFQRVSFSGQALVGGESLADTLRGNVIGLQLSGVGTVDDQAKAASLMQTLLSGASFHGAASRATDQGLLIQYDNGIVLQLSVKGNTLMGCGSWEAQSFLDAFREAAAP